MKKKKKTENERKDKTERLTKPNRHTDVEKNGNAEILKNFSYFSLWYLFITDSSLLFPFI